MHLLEVIFASSQAEEAKFGGPKQATDNNAGRKNGASPLGCGQKSTIRRSFGISKPLFSFLGWRIFSRNRRNSISVNRPWLPQLRILARLLRASLLKCATGFFLGDACGGPLY